jgi:PhnB protein
MQVNPYVSFNGTCQQAFDLYIRVLGGKYIFKMTHGESPMADRVPADWQDKIMHATIAAGDQLIQGMDAPGAHYSKPQGFSLAISTKDPQEADRIFNALSEKGTLTMPLAETFWALKFGMFTDQFGIPWMINCEKPQP